jgi:hypothetical protein
MNGLLFAETETHSLDWNRALHPCKLCGPTATTKVSELSACHLEQHSGLKTFSGIILMSEASISFFEMIMDKS